MNQYQKIAEARKTLQLPERATMKEIKSNYKALITKWHPDTCKEDKDKCQEMTQKITRAYDIIFNYCTHYKFSFSREEIKNHLPGEEWWLERFGSDPIWGKD